MASLLKLKNKCGFRKRLKQQGHIIRRRKLKKRYKLTG